MTTNKLPPDPDGMNDQRAEWADQSIACFQDATNTEDENAICDLLANIMHRCDQRGDNFAEELRRALTHYDAETAMQGKQSNGIRVQV